MIPRPPTPTRLNHFDARVIAAALLKRLPQLVEVTDAHDGTVYAVTPFGLRLYARNHMTMGRGAGRLLLLSRNTTVGMTLQPTVLVPARIRICLSNILSRIEEIAGTTRRWSTNATNHLQHHHLPAEVAFDTVQAIPQRDDFLLFDPLLSAVLDATYADRTPDGGTRSWRAEAAARYRPEPVTDAALAAALSEQIGS